MNNTTSHWVQRQTVVIFCDLWSVPAPRQRAAFRVLQHLSVAFINFQPCILCHIICATAVRSLWLSGCQKEGLVARWQDWGVKHRRLFFFPSSSFFSFLSRKISTSQKFAAYRWFLRHSVLKCERWRWVVIFLKSQSMETKWRKWFSFTPHAPFDLIVWYYFLGKFSCVVNFSLGCLQNL